MKLVLVLLISALLLLALRPTARLGAAEGRPTVLLLGDSLTARWDWADSLPGYRALNYGRDGDRTEDIWARLAQVEAARADLIILQAGINDFWGGADPQLTLDNHRRIWRRLKKSLPGTQLAVASLLPVDVRYGELNELIKKLNLRLAAMAEAEALSFIDLHAALADASGALPPSYSVDGLHLSEAAYRIWADRLACFLASLEGAEELWP